MSEEVVKIVKELSANTEAILASVTGSASAQEKEAKIQELIHSSTEGYKSLQSIVGANLTLMDRVFLLSASFAVALARP